MQRKRSKSNKKTNKETFTCKKTSNLNSYNSMGFVVHMQKALYNKYSSQHFTYLQRIDQQIKSSNSEHENKEYMEKYYKSMQRKHQFHQIKEIYKLHTQYPRLFLPEIRDLLTKCQHRKRLLQYFKIAKILGLKVESIKFSTFLFSLSKSLNPNLQKKSYDRIIGQISGYQFSEEIEKQLLETLEGKSISKQKPTQKKINLTDRKMIKKSKNISVNPQVFENNQDVIQSCKLPQKKIQYISEISEDITQNSSLKLNKKQKSTKKNIQKHKFSKINSDVVNSKLSGKRNRSNNSKSLIKKNISNSQKSKKLKN